MERKLSDYTRECECTVDTLQVFTKIDSFKSWCEIKGHIFDISELTRPTIFFLEKMPLSCGIDTTDEIKKILEIEKKEELLRGECDLIEKSAINIRASLIEKLCKNVGKDYEDYYGLREEE